MTTLHATARLRAGLVILAALVASLSLSSRAAAQPFDLSWYTIDGGGGTSSGGSFTLSGTIGQPDVGTMSGGTFELKGGFWAGGGTAPTGCNPADIVGVGGTPPPDGALTGDDYISWVGAFFGGDLLADIVAIGGSPPPDGLLTGDDYIAFFGNFFGGC